MRQTVGVLMGGWGEEREISMRSGRAVVKALRRLGSRAVPLVVGPGIEPLLQVTTLDVAFVALHGRKGEDGRIQGLLELLDIPYTGSGVLASALAMDKPRAKRVFEQVCVPTPRGYEVRHEQILSLPELHGDLGFPCIVKPARSGSSVAVTKVVEADALHEAVVRAAAFDGHAMVERFVAGREVTVGILKDRVLGSCEIEHGGATFDYAAKYEHPQRYHVPPRLRPERLRDLESLALRAYEALGCRGFGRVDFIVSDEGNEAILEVNTLPAFTASSLLPKIARGAGLSFEDLVKEILSLARLDEGMGRGPLEPFDTMSGRI